MAWTVYILHCADGTYYTGITTDLPARVARHAAGKGARYTKGRGPFEVVYSERCENRSVASKREREIKALSKVQKRALASHSALEKAAP